MSLKNSGAINNKQKSAIAGTLRYSLVPRAAASIAQPFSSIALFNNKGSTFIFL
jgi:hypothetical protein